MTDGEKTGGEKLRAWIKTHGVSHEELSKRVGVSRPMIGKWIKGGEGPLRYRHAYRLQLATMFVSEDDVEFVAPIKITDWNWPVGSIDQDRYRDLVSALQKIGARTEAARRRAFAKQLKEGDAKAREALEHLGRTPAGRESLGLSAEQVRKLSRANLYSSHAGAPSDPTGGLLTAILAVLDGD